MGCCSSPTAEEEAIRALIQSLGGNPDQVVPSSSPTNVQLLRLLGVVLATTGGGTGTADPLAVELSGFPTVTENVGGISNGDNINGLTLRQFITSMIATYQAPYFTSFTPNGGSGSSEIIEVGATRTINSFAWATANSGNVATDSIIIRDQSAGVDLLTSEPNDGNAALASPITYSSNSYNAAKQFRITLTDTEGGSKIRNFTIRVYPRYYWGNGVEALASSYTESALLTALSGGSNGLDNSPAGKTMNVSGGGFKWFLVPAGHSMSGRKFYDPNGPADVDMLTPTSIDVTNREGVVITYNAFRTAYYLGASLTAQIIND